MKLPSKERSLLKPKGFKPLYPALESALEIDVAIVGGGIAGLSAGYLLKQAGLKVAVLEKDCIGSGTTGHTTGKVTAQHNLMYAAMADHLGEKTAKIYGQANQRALSEIEAIIKAEKIDCGWQMADNYVFTADTKRVSEFSKEASVAAKLGLPASFETRSPLPFNISAAVKFADQAHFSAQKYIEGLAEKISGRGSHVFERTKATSFTDGTICRVGVGDHTITARHVVIATNVPTFPLAARLSYCLFEYPTTSYIVAGKPEIQLKGMYISPDSDHYSILPVGDTLLIGGENHVRGLGRARPRQQKLAEYGEKYFGIKKIDYRWHAYDYIAYDGVPLAGKLYPWSQHTYVITAFKKWGLTNSYVAAEIVRDAILNKAHEAAQIYQPYRTSLIKSIPRVAVEHFS